MPQRRYILPHPPRHCGASATHRRTGCEKRGGRYVCLFVTGKETRSEQAFPAGRAQAMLGATMPLELRPRGRAHPLFENRQLLSDTSPPTPASRTTAQRSLP